MSKRVLIVDDAYFMRNLLKKALKEAGYDVIGEAKNGKEGIKLYFELKPDIVTMDINMPDISGIEVTKQILSKDPHAKIIAVTGNNDDAVKQEILNAGALEYLQKPFQPAFLWSKIDKMFEVLEESFEAEDRLEDVPVQPSTSPVVTLESVEDSFDDVEIEVMDKPDESKSQTFVIENDTDKIEFPDEYKEVAEEESKNFELSKEKLEEEDEVLVDFEADNHPVVLNQSEEATIEFEVETPKQTTPVAPRKPAYQEPVKPTLLRTPERPISQKPKESLVTTVESSKKKKPESSHEHQAGRTSYTKSGREVNIRPPRAKLLREDGIHNTQDNREVNEPILNDSEKDNYNDKNNGLLGTFKKLFKK